MAEIYINLGQEINDYDINAFRRRLKSVNPGEEVIIRIEAADAHQADRIVDELRNHGFDYQPHGGHAGEYFLTARKKG
ncbi:hypothetical protein [Thermosediminibacter litoriperuensis]|uniref:TusA-related sulfurtransferase n=1 Tax=Thermosediminibacter litoriperuensis TaxID=291989 RepID=A0A5S5APL9_9FIRM|nr:hypothetical protein [Thermosediminibacter litoriperuensis]TYP53258.1 hypothetical protein LZ11_01609 [Thermosediminibacter litoriperuensis]